MSRSSEHIFFSRESRRSSTRRSTVSEEEVTREIRDHSLPSDAYFPLDPTTSGDLPVVPSRAVFRRYYTNLSYNTTQTTGSIGETANNDDIQGGETLNESLPSVYVNATLEHETITSFVQEVQEILKLSETTVDRLVCLVSTNLNLQSGEKLRQPAKNLLDRWTRLQEKMKYTINQNNMSLLDFAVSFFLLERLTDNFAMLKLPSILTQIKIAAKFDHGPFQQKDAPLLEKIKLQLECLSREIDEHTASVENDPNLSKVGLYCPLSHLKQEFDGRKLLKKLEETREKLVELGKRHDRPKGVTDFWYLLSEIWEENEDALSVQDKWKNEEEVSLVDRVLFVKQFVEVQVILNLAEDGRHIFEFELDSCKETAGQDSAPREELIHKLELQIKKHREYLRFMRKGRNERKDFIIEPEVQNVWSNQRAATGPTLEKVVYSNTDDEHRQNQPAQEPQQARPKTKKKAKGILARFSARRKVNLDQEPRLSQNNEHDDYYYDYLYFDYYN